jgi:uncharacterized protein
MEPLWSNLRQMPVRLTIVMVRGYQRFVSPLLGQQCRFHPSCSQYAVEALRKYGFIRGSWKAIWRIARCNPLHPGGEDLP